MPTKSSKAKSPNKKLVKRGGSSKLKIENKKALSALAAGSLGALGTIGAYYLYKKKRNPKLMTEAAIKKEIIVLQRTKDELDEKYDTLPNNLMMNISNAFRLPLSPIPVLQQKQYNEIAKRVKELSSELARRTRVKKEQIQEELETLKTQIKNIEEDIQENQNKINNKLWEQGLLVYNGVYPESEESAKYNQPFRDAIQAAKDSTVSLFSKIRKLEDELKKFTE